MGVDIVAYRCRIGLFNLCKRKGHDKPPKRKKFKQYSAETSGSDVQFRVFAMCIIIGTQLILADLLLLAIRGYSSRLYEESDDYYRGLSEASHGFKSVTTPYNMDSGCHYTYLGLSQRLLMLSADVETNPGPVTDTELLLQEIRSSKFELLEELKSVKSDIKLIKDEVAEIKLDNTVTKSNVAKLQSKQSDFETKLKDMEKELERVKQEKETMQLDIDALADDLDNKVEIINKLDNDIDQLEAYSRRDSVRVFGLPIQENENYETIKQYVIDEVLSVVRPDIPWAPKDIVRTHRVGSENMDNPDQPRILLIKFLHWDHKMDLYKGREALREKDIHVGDDLTRRQRQTLKRFADSGRYGYYYKGKLHFKEKSQGPRVESRTFRKAHRRMNEMPRDAEPSTSYTPWQATNSGNSEAHMDVSYMGNVSGTPTLPTSPNGLDTEL